MSQQAWNVYLNGKLIDTVFYDDVEYTGIELSKWAVKNTPYKDLNLIQDNITESKFIGEYDLVLCIDILEHLEYDKLELKCKTDDIQNCPHDVSDYTVCPTYTDWLEDV